MASNLLTPPWLALATTNTGAAGDNATAQNPHALGAIDQVDESDTDLDSDGGQRLSQHEDMMDVEAQHAESHDEMDTANGGSEGSDDLAGLSSAPSSLPVAPTGAITGTMLNVASLLTTPGLPESEPGHIPQSSSAGDSTVPIPLELLLQQYFDGHIPAGPPTWSHGPAINPELLTHIHNIWGSDVADVADGSVLSSVMAGEIPPATASPADYDVDLEEDLAFTFEEADPGLTVAGAVGNSGHTLAGAQEEQNNLSLSEFLYGWCTFAFQSTRKKRRPNLPNYQQFIREKPNSEVRRDDLRGDRCDFQGINWRKLEVTRLEARQLRAELYKNYMNLEPPCWHASALRRFTIPSTENFFKFKRMDFKPQIPMPHFQLRNLMACTSKSHVVYVGTNNKIYGLNTRYGQKAVHMDLSESLLQYPTPPTFSGHAIPISTMTAGYNVLIAGGFNGEYAMTRMDRPAGEGVIQGLLTSDPNPITNHAQIYKNRHSGQPLAAFASNDKHVRILDCTINKILAEHAYTYALNCSAISPDYRLRVIVGDSENVIITDAERGDILQDLSAHTDYGFACAWADNGWHVATGNQDKTIKIWDARMWTGSNGVGKPCATVAASLAGVRSLKFSPIGSGKNVLVAAEAADVVCIINCDTYASKQSFDLFGEIVGVDFSPDGRSLFVGVHDTLRGGIMELERCDFGGSGEEAWKESVQELVADSRTMRTAMHRRRRAVPEWDLGVI